MSSNTEFPTSFTVGDRMYDLVDFMEMDEKPIISDTMLERARELEAEFGEEDARFILEHQNEIPTEILRMIKMVFVKWRDPAREQYIAYLCWDGHSEWFQRWRYLGFVWGCDFLLVRRVQ